MKERLNFDVDAKCIFLEDDVNATDPLGKTAFYVPEKKEIYVFVTNRHPKDTFRSLSHEIIHHNQNISGLLSNQENINPGYAQEDKHLREMERQAYEQGNMLFRDFEDNIKKENSQMNNEKLTSAVHEAIAGVLKQYRTPSAQQTVEASNNIALDATENSLEEVETVEEKETFMPANKEHLHENKLRLNEKLLKKWCK